MADRHDYKVLAALENGVVTHAELTRIATMAARQRCRLAGWIDWGPKPFHDWQITDAGRAELNRRRAAANQPEVDG